MKDKTLGGLVGIFEKLMDDPPRSCTLPFLRNTLKARAKSTAHQERVYERAHTATGKIIELMQRVGGIAEKLARNQLTRANRRVVTARKRASAQGREP